MEVEERFYLNYEELKLCLFKIGHQVSKPFLS